MYHNKDVMLRYQRILPCCCPPCHAPSPIRGSCVHVHGVGPPLQQSDEGLVVTRGLEEVLHMSGLKGAGGKECMCDCLRVCLLARRGKNLLPDFFLTMILNTTKNWLFWAGSCPTAASPSCGLERCMAPRSISNRWGDMIWTWIG